jgi:hypothetical protein
MIKESMPKYRSNRADHEVDKPDYMKSIHDQTIQEINMDHSSDSIDEISLNKS